MKKLNYSVSLTFLLSLSACGDSDKKVSIGGLNYQIPKQYLVVTPPDLNEASLDSDSGMVALSFMEDEDFIEYVGANAWLPVSSITAMFFSREGTELKGIVPSFTNLVSFSLEEKQVVEFEGFYRLFDGDSRISWLLVPKERANFYDGKVEAKWVADCVPRGGVKGIQQTRESVDIPTSCKISIEYGDAVLRLSSSEKNFINEIDNILGLVLRKMNSWEVESR